MTNIRKSVEGRRGGTFGRSLIVGASEIPLESSLSVVD